MRKIDLVKKYLGEKIKTIGFEYSKDISGYSDWTFKREVTGYYNYFDPSVKITEQFISVVKSRFSNEVNLQFQVKNPAPFVRSSGELTDYYTKPLHDKLRGKGSWFPYDNDEEFIEIMKFFAGIILDEDIAKALDKASQCREDVRPKTEIDDFVNNLRMHYKECAEKFGLNKDPKDEEEADECLDKVESILSSMRGKEYGEVKGDLFLISSFLGWLTVDAGKRTRKPSKFFTQEEIDNLVYAPNPFYLLPSSAVQLGPLFPLSDIENWWKMRDGEIYDKKLQYKDMLLTRYGKQA